MTPVCAVCGKPATCIGQYELCDEPPAYACDDCCGHGNEDGWCDPIDEHDAHEADCEVAS